MDRSRGRGREEDNGDKRVVHLSGVYPKVGVFSNEQSLFVKVVIFIEIREVRGH